MINEDHFLNLQPGTIVNGRYEVVKCLGTGSMGLVYACRHRELAGHLVAMKVLFTEVARDAVAAQRFRNEIVASYGVSHPNVVRAYEYFRDGDLVAFTMEYIGGGDLADRIGMDEPIAIPAIIKMLCQMCSGVQAIHDAGIIHRDLKPENILLTVEGDIKITDFGIARTGTGPKLTEHGGVVGTIDYVSPEYLERGQVDTRSDIYALGVLAYEMLTGEAPFKGKSVIETMTMRLRSDPEPPSTLRSDAPLQFNAVVAKAMARDPEERYQTASEMLHDLELLAAELNGFPSQRNNAVRGDAPRNDRSAVDGYQTLRRGEADGAKQRSGRRADPILSSTQAISASVVDSVRKAAENGAIEPMESVLRSNGFGVNSEAPAPNNGTERPAPRITVGQGHLSADRMKQLSKDLYPARSNPFRQVVIWGFVLLLGFGLGVAALRQYRPELFGISPMNLQSPFNE